MNKYLMLFFEDEIKTLDYYSGIRNFIEVKKLGFKDAVYEISNTYNDNVDAFAPYKFMDAVEDFIDDEDFDISKYNEMWEVIDAMWEVDWFVNY